jgi:hypothetical protein
MDGFIFNYNDRKVLAIQSDDTCKFLYSNSLSTLIESEEDETIPPRISQTKARFQRIHWLAKYASAVLLTPISVISFSITLVGLDRWERKVHASLEGRESTAIAEVTQPTECFLGIVARDETNELLANLDAKLKKSEASTGTSRRQTEGHDGNQKTPAFASHVLKELLRGRQPGGVLPIQGGTTLLIHRSNVQSCLHSREMRHQSFRDIAL